jgi:putative flippase GtrA
MLKVIKLLFVERSQNKYIELFRYVIMGGIAFLADFSTFFSLTFFYGVHYLIANFFSFFVGLVTNYSIGTFWVFKERKIEKRNNEFILVLLISVGALLLTQFLLWFFTEIVDVHYTMSKVVASVLVLVYSFAVRKILIYK